MEREREREIKTEKGREEDKERKRDKDREKGREGEKERKRDKEREKEREGERGGGGKLTKTQHTNSWRVKQTKRGQ